MGDKYYLCDYGKHKNCAGKTNGSCQEVCFHTVNKKFSKKGSKPVKYSEIKTKKRLSVKGNAFNKKTV